MFVVFSRGTQAWRSLSCGGWGIYSCRNRGHPGTAKIVLFCRTWCSLRRQPAALPQHRLLNKQPQQVGHCWSAGSLPDTRAVPERRSLRKALPPKQNEWQMMQSCSSLRTLTGLLWNTTPHRDTQQDRSGTSRCVTARLLSSSYRCALPPGTGCTMNNQVKACAGLAEIYFNMSPVLGASHRYTTQQEPLSRHQDRGTGTKISTTVSSSILQSRWQ